MIRWLKRLLLAVLAVVVILAAPVAWTETMCRGPVSPQGPRDPQIGTRDESRTFTTYPEWHIVHAYEDYAHVIATNDPHDFGYFAAISGFWRSLCPLAEMADAHGGFTGESRATIYTIGVSFTAEMALKAAYEETLGRVATWIRGPQRAPLDDLSAAQAAEYAAFLQMTPWYRWGFRADAAALDSVATEVFRDRERGLALGIEYRAKAAYADAIAGAVAATGADVQTMRSEITGLTPEALAEVSGVTVLGTEDGVVTIQTPRYRAFTEIAVQIAALGGKFETIAGNDDILFTAISTSKDDAALFSFPRQGRSDWRLLIVTPVTDLAQRIATLPEQGITLEHIHDY